jgi:hypothetical protein
MNIENFKEKKDVVGIVFSQSKTKKQMSREVFSAGVEAETVLAKRITIE